MTPGRRHRRRATMPAKLQSQAGCPTLAHSPRRRASGRVEWVSRGVWICPIRSPDQGKTGATSTRSLRPSPRQAIASMSSAIARKRVSPPSSVRQKEGSKSFDTVLSRLLAYRQHRVRDGCALTCHPSQTWLDVVLHGGPVLSELSMGQRPDGRMSS